MSQQLPPVLPYAGAPPTGEGSNVRAVGLAQRRIMWVILAALVLVFTLGLSAAGVASTGIPILVVAVVFTLVRLAILALMMIGVFNLAAAMGSSMASRILFVIAMIIPLVNLIVLLVLNQKATGLLRQHNIKVGLMGPRVEDLPVA